MYIERERERAIDRYNRGVFAFLIASFFILATTRLAGSWSKSGFGTAFFFFLGRRFIYTPTLAYPARRVLEAASFLYHLGHVRERLDETLARNGASSIYVV